MASERPLAGRLAAVLGEPLDARTYRWLDRTTKLAALVLIVAALETGPTTTGIALAATGSALGLTTVPIENDE